MQSKSERSLYTNNKVKERFRGGWRIKLWVKLGAKEIEILLGEINFPLSKSPNNEIE
jgi:hypothetical protein